MPELHQKNEVNLERYSMLWTVKYPRKIVFGGSKQQSQPRSA